MPPSVNERRLVVRILAMSISAEPIVGADTKKVRVDRHDLAVQLRKLVQPNAGP